MTCNGLNAIYLHREAGSASLSLSNSHQSLRGCPVGRQAAIFQKAERVYVSLVCSRGVQQYLGTVYKLTSKVLAGVSRLILHLVLRKTYPSSVVPASSQRTPVIRTDLQCDTSLCSLLSAEAAEDADPLHSTSESATRYIYPLVANVGCLVLLAQRESTHC